MIGTHPEHLESLDYDIDGGVYFIPLFVIIDLPLVCKVSHVKFVITKKSCTAWISKKNEMSIFVR